MIVCVRKSFDEIPAAVCLFFHTVNGEGSWIPLPAILRAFTMCFSEGDSKLKSRRASRRQTQTRRRFTDTPVSLGEVSHEGENKEAGEEIISLDTDRKIRGPGLVLKSYAPEFLFCFSQRKLHTTILWRNICVGSTEKQTSISPDISYQEV